VRFTDWGILALHTIASRIDGITDDLHLTTDPACEQYRPVRLGSRLHRASRGESCTLCMSRRAFDGETCRVVHLHPTPKGTAS
jgi:hypothetical protein